MSFNLGTAEGRIVIDGSGAQKGFSVATVAAKAFYAAIESKLGSIEKLGTNLTRLGTTGSVGLGVAVKAAASFEAGLSAVKAVSGATVDQMDKVREAALRIGKDTSFSATEATSAIEELVKAGVSVEDVLNGAADATVNLAAAGGVSLPEAAEIASSAINNFGLKGRELPHVADLIAGAANASAISVGDFGFSLSQAGAVANLTGLSFDDLAVAIAEMGQAGIKGSDAGTSIKTFLTNLIPTTDKQTALFEKLGLVTVRTGAGFKKMAELGIKPASKSYEDISAALQQYVEASGGSEQGTAKNAKAAQELGQELGVTGNAFFDAQGNMKSFKEVQEILQNSTKDLTKEQKLQALETLFGSDALRASAVFANQGAEGFEKMAGAMSKVSAADVATTRLDNLNGSIERLKGSFETMLIVIGEVFLPVVRKFVDGINFMVNIFNSLPPFLQKTIAVFIGLGSVTSLLTGLLIKLGFVLVPLLAKFLGFAALKGIFSIFTVGFNALRGGAGAAAALSLALGRMGVVFGRIAKVSKFLFGVLVKIPKVMAALRFAAAFAFGPWGIAIAVVVTALTLLFNKFQPFHDLVVKVGNAIKTFFVGALNEAKEVFTAFTTAFSSGDPLGAFSDKLFGVQRAGAALRTVFDGLVAVFRNQLMPALRESGGQILTALREAWTSLSNSFRTQILPALMQLRESFASLRPALQGLWTAISPVIVVIGKLAAMIVGSLIVAQIQWWKLLFGTIIPVLIQLATVVIVAVIRAITFLVTAIAVVIAKIIEWGAVLVGVISPALNAMWKVITAVFGAIAEVVGAAISKTVAVLTEGLNRAKAVWQAVWGLFGPLVKAVWSLIYNVVKLAIVAVVVLVSIWLDTMFKMWKSIWNLVVSVVRSAWGTIKTVVTASANAVKNALSAAWNFIKSVTGSAWRTIQNLVTNAIRSVASMVSSRLAFIRSAISSAWSYLNSSTNGAWGRFFSTITGRISAAMGKVRAIRGQVQGALSGAGSWLYNAGRNIIQGLLSGINSMIGSVKSSLNKLTGLIPSWKGPLSVDKRLLTPNGEAIMESLIRAFESKMPDVQRSLRGITAAIPVQVTTAAMDSKPSGAQRQRAASLTQAQAAVTREVNYNTTVNNPLPEPAGTSINKRLQKITLIGP